MPDSTAQNSQSTPNFFERIQQMEESAIEHKVSKKNLFVIFSREKWSVLHDPMTNKPVTASNPNMLTEASKAFKGEIITAQEAVNRLLKGK